jgi:hypothetical protein
MAGRRITDLMNAVRPAGWHTLTLTSPALPAGEYLIRLVAGSEVKTIGVTFVK